MIIEPGENNWGGLRGYIARKDIEQYKDWVNPLVTCTIGQFQFVTTLPLRRWISGDWWCSTRPSKFGGLWWEQIGDRETNEVWFHNKTAETIRPWVAGDEHIRDGYIETQPCIDVSLTNLPTIDAARQEFQKIHGHEVEPDEKWLLLLIWLRLVDQTVPRPPTNIVDALRYGPYQTPWYHLQVEHHAETCLNH